MKSFLSISPAEPGVFVPRRYIWVAAGAFGAVGAMALRRYLDGNRQRAEGGEATGPARGATPGAERSPPPAAAEVDPAKPPRPAASTGAKSETPAQQERTGLPGGARELSEFLAGDSWFDEGGWSGIWEREGIDDAAAWLREEGLGVLRTERAKLADHPALLAGCRRRWIVVCRYAGVDVGEAAALWNETDAP